MADYDVFARAGALFTFGSDDAAQMQKLAVYVDRILKGDKPADLPIEQPTQFRIVVNAATARTLGLAIPPSILVRADEVIE